MRGNMQTSCRWDLKQHIKFIIIYSISNCRSQSKWWCLSFSVEFHYRVHYRVKISFLLSFKLIFKNSHKYRHCTSFPTWQEKCDAPQSSIIWLVPHTGDPFETFTAYLKGGSAWRRLNCCRSCFILPWLFPILYFSSNDESGSYAMTFPI